MPQMNPMNWFILFLFFNSILFFSFLKIFYMKISSFEENKKIVSNKTLKNLTLLI